MFKRVILTVATVLLPVVGMAQVTERDLTAVFPTQQAEVIWDVATQGTVEGNSITFQRDSALQNFLIAPNSVDATDDAIVCIAGGGACTTNGTRGAYIFLEGNEYTTGGQLSAFSGTTAGADAWFGTLATDGETVLFAGAGATYMTLASTGHSMRLAGDADRFISFVGASDTALNLTYGAAAVAAQVFNIVSLTADAADNDSIFISGGGAADPTRGGYFFASGNEHATQPGFAQISAGSVSGSAVRFFSPATNGYVSFSTNGTTALTIQSDQDADFAGEITSSETGSLGWSLVSAANQACTTTCTGAAVFGWDTGTSLLVGPATATADHCICAAAS